MEDSANKPGLVAEDCFNLTRTGILMDPRAAAPAAAAPATSNVFFPVTYGDLPRLTVVFLVRARGCFFGVPRQPLPTPVLSP